MQIKSFGSGYPKVNEQKGIKSLSAATGPAVQTGGGLPWLEVGGQDWGHSVLSQYNMTPLYLQL